jgi:hypothetical protein
MFGSYHNYGRKTDKLKQEMTIATFNLRRFSKPGMLRMIEPEHLIAFLEPYADYFSNRGVELPSIGNGDELDYKALSQALLNPNASTPDDLAEALYYVNEMSTQEGFDSLQEAIADTDMDVVIGENAAISAHPVTRSVWWNSVNGFVRKFSKRFHTVISYSAYRKYFAGIFSTIESCFPISPVVPGKL